MAIPHFLEALSERLRSSANVKTIYGDPLQAEGKTIIPVARIAYGLGGGYGEMKTTDENGHTEEKPEGEGGGGGIIVTPVGVIEVSREKVKFIPLQRSKVMLAAGFLVGFVLGRILGKARGVGLLKSEERDSSRIP
jgi:uncharacterized spore protein YtfJ